MASMDEIRAQLSAASSMLDEAAGFASGVSTKVEDATQHARASFEGTGRDELMRELGRLDALGIQASDVLVECLSISSALQAIASAL